MDIIKLPTFAKIRTRGVTQRGNPAQIFPFTFRWLVVNALTVTLVGCAPTAPEVHIFEPLPRGIEPAIYLTAALQKEAILRTLRDAGFHLVDHMADGAYLLRITLGVSQGSRPCGTLHNVRYQLRFQGRTMVEAEAKGWTGSCEPNVFDAISREMRRCIVETTTQ